MSTLSRIFTAINKRYKALDEDINLSDYVQAHALDVKVNSEPFNHVVIDNFFKEDFLEELTHYYQTIFSKGLVDDDAEKERFHLSEKTKKFSYPYTFPAAIMRAPFTTQGSRTGRASSSSKLNHRASKISSSDTFNSPPTISPQKRCMGNIRNSALI
jgi:hypothetical protein